VITYTTSDNRFSIWITNRPVHRYTANYNVIIRKHGVTRKLFSHSVTNEFSQNL